MNIKPKSLGRNFVPRNSTISISRFDSKGEQVEGRIKAKKIDLAHSHALYMDLELTCWNSSPPPGMKPEIIEIGIVEMDLANLNITKEAGYFVRPRRWEISSKCTKLTGIIAEDIRKARPLAEVLASLTRKFKPSDKPCGTWGDDVAIVTRSCASHSLVSPFGQEIDLCRLFQSAFVMREQMSLGSAINMLGLEFDGVPHGALADARNTARLHAAILRRLRGQPTTPLLTAILPGSMSLSPFGQKLKQCIENDPLRSTANEKRPSILKEMGGDTSL